MVRYIDSLDGATNDKRLKKWFQKMTIQQFQLGKSIPEYVVVCNAMAQYFLTLQIAMLQKCNTV